MISEHQSIATNEFKGLFDKGSDEAPPLGFFVDTLNTVFNTNSVSTREGSVNEYSSGKTILRWRTFEKTGEATRYLYLDNTGKLYDSTLPSSPILTISGMKDFALQVMFDRAYISPHNGDKGLPGEYLYVYDGTGIARLAGGTAPTAPMIVTTSATAGNIEAGKRIFGVSFETASGFITKPIPSAVYNGPGGKSVDLSNIPIGPAGTIARWIQSTKAILTTYSGNPAEYEAFFVPNGRIGNNTATTMTVSFFDSELASSADYLQDQLDKIPAGNYLGIYKGALVSLGEDSEPARVRMSIFSQPESFDAVTGLIDVYPKDNGGPVRSCVEFRSQLIIHKSYRAYVTQDNGDTPDTWTVSSLDKSVGSECNGICRILDVDGTSIDNFLVASHTGLMAFDGSYSQNLTASIHDVWMRINRLNFQKVLVALDPLMGRIYVAVPLDSATECSHILYCDTSNEFTTQSAQWSIWKMKNGISLTGNFVDIVFSNRVATFEYGGLDGNLYKMDENATDDDGIAIESYIKFPYLNVESLGGIQLFSGIRLLISGNGQLEIHAESLDGLLSLDAPTITLIDKPGVEKTRQFFLENERCSVKIRTSAFGEWFNLKHFRLFCTPIWAERPE